MTLEWFVKLEIFWCKEFDMYKSAAQLLYGSVLVIFYYSLHLMCVYISLVQRLNTLQGFNPAQGRSLRAVPCTSSNYFPLSVIIFPASSGNRSSYFILLRSSVLRLLMFSFFVFLWCKIIIFYIVEALGAETVNVLVLFLWLKVCCKIQCFAAKGENTIYLCFC